MKVKVTTRFRDKFNPAIIYMAGQTCVFDEARALSLIERGLAAAVEAPAPKAEPIAEQPAEPAEPIAPAEPATPAEQPALDLQAEVEQPAEPAEVVEQPAEVAHRPKRARKTKESTQD